MEHTSIAQLAKECRTHTGRIIEWAADNGEDIVMAAAKNGKTARSVRNDCADAFRDFCRTQKLPEGSITFPELIKELGIDRKTVQALADKCGIVFKTFRRLGSEKPAPSVRYIAMAESEKIRSEIGSGVSAVSIKSLCREFKTDRRVISRWMEREKRKLVKCPHRGAWRNAMSTLDAEECRQFLTDLKSRGFFYMIQLIPQHFPNRIKLGFAYDVERRLSDHQVTCPEAVILSYWKCRRDQETSVIKAITKNGCIAKTREVFDCENYQDILAETERFFMNHSSSL